MTTTPDPAALASDLRAVLGRLIRRLRAERSGIPLNQVTVIGHLDREGPASISDLAAAQRVRPQSMAATVSALEAAGLVSRAPDPSDGRRVILTLTAFGQQTITADRAERIEFLADAIERDLDARERAVLAEAVVLIERMLAED